MSSLNATGLLNMPILVDKYVDLSSQKIESMSRIGQKIESISRIGLLNLKRNRPFLGGGGRGILDTDVSW